MKEGTYVRADTSPKEKHNDETTRDHQLAAVPLFSSPASTLFLAQLESLTAPSGPQPGSPAPMWARRLCGRWLLAQRLRLGITTEVIEERGRVGAATQQLLELGLANDIGADDDRLNELAQLLADPQRDVDLVMAALRVAIGATSMSPSLLERVVGDIRPPMPPLDDGAE